MEDVREKKREVFRDVTSLLASQDKSESTRKMRSIEERLFDFANFLESKIALFYADQNDLVPTYSMIRRCYSLNKIVVLPTFSPGKTEMTLRKVDDPENDMVPSTRGLLHPDPERCKVIPIEFVDIAIIPGIAFDEKGGRLGSGDRYYEHLIPKLPVTTRKVALAFEIQIVPQVPMEVNDRYVDIIITENRIIYKI